VQRPGGVAEERNGDPAISRHADARPLLVLWNSRAGTRSGGREEIVRQLEEAGIAADVRAVAGGELRSEAAAAARAGRAVLGVAGGDGSMQAVASVLAGGGTVLAPLPTGTLNHFARRLGIPDLATAAAAIAAGATRRVPFGRLGDLRFLNTATFGEYGRLVVLRERLRRWLPKWFAAGLAAAAVALSLHFLDVELEIDGEVRSYRTSLVWVGVGSGSFPFPHEAETEPPDVPLEVTVLQPSHLPSLIVHLARLRRAGGDRARPRTGGGLEIVQTQILRLRASHRVGVTIDGEPHRLEPPLTVEIEQRALRVVVPGP
jgi:diacylglycerol kinase family enzyme